MNNALRIALFTTFNIIRNQQRITEQNEKRKNLEKIKKENKMNEERRESYNVNF